VDANLFALAGGYNEYLHGWGYDDIDLFERLLLIQDMELRILNSPIMLKYLVGLVRM
jgi:predicted glycosyltransferase involved in capsule biosynthesis